jgi:hypothetical protein
VQGSTAKATPLAIEKPADTPGDSAGVLGSSSPSLWVSAPTVTLFVAPASAHSRGPRQAGVPNAPGLARWGGSPVLAWWGGVSHGAQVVF